MYARFPLNGTGGELKFSLQASLWPSVVFLSLCVDLSEGGPSPSSASFVSPFHHWASPEFPSLYGDHQLLGTERGIRRFFPIIFNF